MESAELVLALFIAVAALVTIARRVGIAYPIFLMIGGLVLGLVPGIPRGDEAKSQGWTALILDTNGNGKGDDDYVEPDRPVDPRRTSGSPRPSTASPSTRRTARCGARCWASPASSSG